MPGCRALSFWARPYGDYSRQGAGSGVDQLESLAGAKKEVGLGAGFWWVGARAPEFPAANHSPHY
jgi:hypothetical protein